MSGLTVTEMAEHLEMTLRLAPTWSEEQDTFEHMQFRAFVRNAAWALDMELSIGPPERSEVDGQAIYTWPLQPRGFREPILLPFRHGWSKSWSWL